MAAAKSPAILAAVVEQPPRPAYTALASRPSRLGLTRRTPRFLVPQRVVLKNVVLKNLALTSLGVVLTLTLLSDAKSTGDARLVSEITRSHLVYDQIKKLQRVVEEQEEELQHMKKYKNLYEDARIRLLNMERMSAIMQQYCNPL